MDPITGTIKTNNYHIVSFRLFKEKTMGFSDDNLKAIFSSAFSEMRQVLLGKVDPIGLEADVNDKFAQTQTGNVDGIKDQFDQYMKAGDLEWIKATDCPKTICPPCPVPVEATNALPSAPSVTSSGATLVEPATTSTANPVTPHIKNSLVQEILGSIEKYLGIK